jgi:hypothetical protein
MKLFTTYRQEMTRRKFLNGVAAITIIISLALLINFYTIRFGLNSLPLNFETVSPDKTYTVRIKELRETHVIPFTDIGDPAGCPAEFSVYKNGRPLIEKMDIGDDSNLFSDLYPDHYWVSDSVFRIGDKDPEELGHDEVVVTNNSGQALEYLRVKTCKWEMFWLFDVQPGSTTKLSVCPQTNTRADVSGISSYGKFFDGRDIPFATAGFKIRGKYKAPGHYSVTVTDAETKIDSPDFEVSK